MDCERRKHTTAIVSGQIEGDSFFFKSPKIGPTAYRVGAYAETLKGQTRQIG